MMMMMMTVREHDIMKQKTAKRKKKNICENTTCSKTKIKYTQRKKKEAKDRIGSLRDVL